jgi:30S ribosomal protein S31
MGKGDKRTRRGKIYRGSFGKSRPKSTATAKPAARPTISARATVAAKAPSRGSSRAK